MKYLISFLTMISFIMFTFSGCGGSRSADSGDFPYTINPDDTIYEDGEDGDTANWLDYFPHKVENAEEGSNESKRSILVKEDWLRDKNGNLAPDAYGQLTNLAYYELPMDNNYQFILEFDKKRKISNPSYCFIVGIKVDTKLGERHISFNTYYDLVDATAISQEWQTGDGKNITEFVFPLSMDYVNEVGVWQRLKFDIEDYLHEFEPNNEINSVISFYFVGGDDYLDNIRLSTKE